MDLFFVFEVYAYVSGCFGRHRLYPKLKRMHKEINKLKRKQSEEERNAYWVSSSVAGSTEEAVAASFVTSSTGKPLAARFATAPIFVVGVYAPPANVYSHLPHCQTPTLFRLTRTKPQLGHRCGFLSSVITRI